MFHLHGGKLYQATSWLIGPYWTIQYRDGSALVFRSFRDAMQVLGLRRLTQ